MYATDRMYLYKYMFEYFLIIMFMYKLVSIVNIARKTQVRTFKLTIQFECYYYTP